MGPADIVARLRRVRPTTLTAVSATGDRRAIAVPSGRRRKWEQVTRTLARLEWVTLELADAQGALLEVLDARDGAEDGGVEEVVALPDARAAGNLELMLRAQEVALMRQERGLGQVLAAYQALVQTFSERLMSLERSYASILQLAHDAATSHPDQAGDALVASMAPAILQRLVPNGAPHPKGK